MKCYEATHKHSGNRTFLVCNGETCYPFHGRFPGQEEEIRQAKPDFLEFVRSTPWLATVPQGEYDIDALLWETAEQVVE